MSLIGTATPGSDQQLALVNALTVALLGKPELDALAGWLTGDGVPDGLVVDTDLRWRLLQALAAHGIVTDNEIRAEQEEIIPRERMHPILDQVPQPPNQTPMPCTTPTGKNSAAAIMSGCMPLAAQKPIEVSQAA